MIQITINTEENKIKVTCEVNAKGEAAVEEFKTLNEEFPKMREMILKKFPLYLQAIILTDMLEGFTERDED